jgi:tetratricopeptide (TPR) repeat protein
MLLGQGVGRAQEKAAASRAGAIAEQAVTLEKQDEFSKAEAGWKSLVLLEPRNGQAYAHLGLLEARQEHYTEAIAHYRKAQVLAQAQGHEIPELTLDLGLALFKSGEFQEAGKIFESDLRKHPHSADAQRLTSLAAMSEYGAHRYGAAIPYLKDAVAGDSRNLTLLLTLAHCYLWTKQLDATMSVYKQILEIDPNSAAADMIAGEALDEKGDNAGSVQQFREAVKANPREPNVHFGLAYLYWTQKRYDEAIPEFKAELENDPKNYQAMIYLGDTYVKQNNFAMAKPLLEQAMQYRLPVALIHLDMGIVLMETGDRDGAIEQFTKTVAMEPNNVNAHFRLASLYRSMGKKAEASAEYAKASTLNKQRDESLHQRIADANMRPEGSKPDVPAKPDATAQPGPQ